MTNTETNTLLTDLRELTGQLIRVYQPVAVQQSSFFVNDISADRFVTAPVAMLNPVLSSLLYITARCSKNSCLRITARAENERATLIINDSNGENNYAVLYEFQHLKMLALPMQGLLDIQTVRNKETIISFSFSSIQPGTANAIVRELKRA